MSTPEVLDRSGDLWVVSKPAGWVVHPTGDPTQDDLLTWAQSIGAPATIAPLHRLDRETSGVVLLAENPQGHYDLLKGFERGEVKKTYLALVVGHPRPEGTINKMLDDDRRGKKLEASTSYRTLETFERCALLEVSPTTGRKHQIRRHLHGIGFPILGDNRYRPRKRINIPGFPGRLWLHAARLEWGDLSYEAALPDDLLKHLEHLRSMLPEDSATPVT